MGDPFTKGSLCLVGHVVILFLTMHYDPTTHAIDGDGDQDSEQEVPGRRRFTDAHDQLPSLATPQTSCAGL